MEEMSASQLLSGFCTENHWPLVVYLFIYLGFYQIPTFPLQAGPGIEPRPSEVSVLPTTHSTEPLKTVLIN